jgi:hypothetical protein
MDEAQCRAQGDTAPSAWCVGITVPIAHRSDACELIDETILHVLHSCHAEWIARLSGRRDQAQNVLDIRSPEPLDGRAQSTIRRTR